MKKINKMNWISIGSLNLAIAVMCGAFGSHGLKKSVTAVQLEWWQTGTQYFFYHALGLLVVGVLIKQKYAPPAVAWLLQIGILLFVGTLYLMALGLPKTLGMVTPIGGTMFIIAWLWLAIYIFKLKQ